MKLQQVARAVVQHGLDLAKFGAARVEYGETDQVGMIEFIIGQLGQVVARRIEAGPFQGIRLFFRGDAGQPGGEAVLDRARRSFSSALRRVRQRIRRWHRRRQDRSWQPPAQAIGTHDAACLKATIFGREARGMKPRPERKGDQGRGHQAAIKAETG